MRFHLQFGLGLLSLVWHFAAAQPDPKSCMSSGAKLPFGKPTREAYFQFPPNFLNFNHGGFGGTPKPVRQAMEKYTDQMEAGPTAFMQLESGYRGVIEKLRPRMADYLHAKKASNLVFVDDASAGLNAVLRSVPWVQGDVLLLTSVAYALIPNVASWLAQRYGIKIVVAEVPFPFKSSDVFVEAVRKAIAEVDASGGKIRLAVFDHISSFPAVIVPALELTRLVKGHTQGEALVLIDGAHAVAQVDVNLTEFELAGADFYIGNGHKWLMAPHGSGFLWAASSVQDILEPAIISSANSPGSSYHVRFDYIGTRDYTPWCSVGAALDFRATVLGGELCAQKYVLSLGRWTAHYLADFFGTEVAAPENMMAALALVRMPIPTSWSDDAKKKCGSSIQAGLMDPSANVTMQAIIVPIPTLNESSGQKTVEVWARISAQVYLDDTDVRALGHRIKELRKSCKGTTMEQDVGVMSPKQEALQLVEV